MLRNLFLGCLLAGSISAPAYSQAVLSAAELEQISGIKGIKEVPRDPGKGAGGKLNFADASGKLVLLVMLEPMSTLQTWKRSYSKADPVASLGPDGHVAQADPVFGFMLGFVYFSKNGKAVFLQQMGNKPGNVKAPNLDRPALLKIASAIYAKM